MVWASVADAGAVFAGWSASPPRQGYFTTESLSKDVFGASTAPAVLTYLDRSVWGCHRSSAWHNDLMMNR